MMALMRAMLQEAVCEGILLINLVMKFGKLYGSAKKVKEKTDPS